MKGTYLSVFEDTHLNFNDLTDAIGQLIESATASLKKWPT